MTTSALSAAAAATEKQSKRAVCARCLRAQTACICHWQRCISPATEVLILQHPLEVAQAKGSGRLLHLSLHGSRLEVGEQFDAALLQQLLFAPWHGPEPQQTLLLYPETEGMAHAVSAAAGVASGDAGPAHATTGVPLRRLVVLDATWRKSRKMLYLNPLLSQLPRLALQDPPASQYRIRKAHRADQLSTLEAACHALAQLEDDAASYDPLLQAFDGFVAQQAAFVPVPPDC